MLQIEKLEKAYYEIDEFLGSKEFEAREISNSEEEQRWRNDRFMNDHSYFLFVFTRFEDHIREESSKLILNKKDTIEDWKDRASWDILPSNKNDDRFIFMNRVALLTNKSENRYGIIKGYYDLRNKLAHGSEFDDPVDMDDFFENMKTFVEQMKA